MDWSARLQLLKEDPQNEKKLLTEGDIQGLQETVALYLLSSQDELDNNKHAIQQTRAALSYLMLFVSPGGNVSQQQELLQLQVTNAMMKEELLLRIVLSSSPKDATVHLRAARLMNNLVAQNYKASLIFLSTLSFSPSPEYIQERMVSMTLGQETRRPVTSTYSWVDLFLSSRHNRRAMAALVAALYNAIVTIQQEEEQESSIEVISDMAQDALLISTLLRHMLPATSGEADEATEWISYLFQRLCNLAYFETIYNTIGSKSVVTPEHVVFLHCISSTVDDDTGVILDEQTLGFMARQAYELRKTNIVETEQDTADLSESAWICFLEMIASSLSRDDLTHNLRSSIGLLLIPCVAQDLLVIVDGVLGDDKGGVRPSREIDMSTRQQKCTTTMVRLLGNLCYNCRSNQDLMQVPLVTDASERAPLHILLTCTSLSIACFTLREWSVVALRYVLHQHEANQQLVAELQAQTPVQSENLERMGLSVEMDSMSGQVKVVPNEQPPSNA